MIVVAAQSEAGPSRTAASLASQPTSASPSPPSHRNARTKLMYRQRKAQQHREEDDVDTLHMSPSPPASALPSPSLASPQSPRTSPALPRSAIRSALPRPAIARTRPTASMFSSLLPLFVTFALLLTMVTHLPRQVAAVDAGEPNNVTTLEGTWSTGSAKVITGINFYNPVNASFNVPTAGGQSYSFTNDGYYEEALYIYSDNAAKPSCVSAQLIWQHGTYVRNQNNSLSLTPFKGDGRQVVEDRCSSTSTTSSYYYQEEYMLGFDIVLDTHYGKTAYRLQLYAYDGSLKPLMWQVYNPPEMLPTQLLVETIYGAT